MFFGMDMNGERAKMTDFSVCSLANLQGVHPTLVDLIKEITQFFDCSILGGTRTAEEQTEFLAKGMTQTMNSLHLIQKDGYGHAIDVAPTPQQWDNSPQAKLTKYEVQCIAFLFYAKGYAQAKGIKIRIGADWNGNNLWTDNMFNDLDHIELPLSD